MKVKTMTGLFANAFRALIAAVLAIGVVISISANAMALSYTSDAPTTGELARERLKDQIEGVFGDEPNDRLPGRVRGNYEKDREGLSTVPTKAKTAETEAEKKANQGFNKANQSLNKARGAAEDAAGEARNNVENFADSVKESVRDLVD